MSSSEQFSWFEPSKKTKKSSSESSYLNAPAGGSSAAEHVDMSQKHEHDIDLHPRVLPAPLFDKLVGAENKARRLVELPHIPIPFESGADIAEKRPDNDPHNPAQDTEGSAESDKDEGEEEDSDEDGQGSTPKKKVPAADSHAGPLATQSGAAHSAVERLIERLDEELEATSEAPEASGETESGPETRPPERFMPLESEPAPEGRTPVAPEYSQFGSGTHTEREPDEPRASHAGGPPPPPPGPPPSFGLERSPAPEPEGAGGARVSEHGLADTYMHNPALATPERTYSYAATPAITPELQQKAINEAEYYAEKRGLRRGLVAGFITGYVVKQFLANRKQRRFEAAAQQQMEQRDRQMAEMTGAQTRMSEQMADQQRQIERYQYNQAPATRYERPAYPQAQEDQRLEQPEAAMAPAAARPEQRPVPVPGQPEQAPAPVQPVNLEQLQQAPANEQEVVLPPGWRLERRGWYSVVVDEHGREVQGALNYGEAFHREQRREQAPAALNNMGGAGGGPVGDGAYMGDAVGAQAVNGMLGSGQADPAHTLQAGQPQPIDPNRRLAVRQNPIVATIANPVVWLAFAVIVIAYFIAALL